MSSSHPLNNFDFPIEITSDELLLNDPHSDLASARSKMQEGNVDRGLQYYQEVIAAREEEYVIAVYNDLAHYRDEFHPVIAAMEARYVGIYQVALQNKKFSILKEQINVGQKNFFGIKKSRELIKKLARNNCLLAMLYLACDYVAAKQNQKAMCLYLEILALALLPGQAIARYFFNADELVKIVNEAQTYLTRIHNLSDYPSRCFARWASNYADKFFKMNDLHDKHPAELILEELKKFELPGFEEITLGRNQSSLADFYRLGRQQALGLPDDWFEQYIPKTKSLLASLSLFSSSEDHEQKISAATSIPEWQTMVDEVPKP